MSTLNKCFLLGNLTRDPEMKFTQSGTGVCRFGLAVNQTIKDRKTVEFFNIVTFGKTAESCQNWLAKGRPVLVEGHLHNNSYEDKQGQKRTSLEIIADNVQFLGSAQDRRPQEPEPTEEELTGPATNNVDPNEDVPF